MTNCVRCGRPISDASYAATANLCPECRQAFAGAARPAPVAQPSMARPAPYRPPVTVTLVGLNILVFVVMVLKGVPLMNPSSAQILPFGADFGPQSLDGQPWRILVSNY